MAVQVVFHSGRVRQYIMEAGPGDNWPVRSFAEADLPGGLDLRRAEHAARLQRALAVP